MVHSKINTSDFSSDLASCVLKQPRLPTDLLEISPTFHHCYNAGQSFGHMVHVTALLGCFVGISVCLSKAVNVCIQNRRSRDPHACSVVSIAIGQAFATCQAFARISDKRMHRFCSVIMQLQALCHAGIWSLITCVHAQVAFVVCLHSANNLICACLAQSAS